jgi:hypothetical protein
VQGLYLDQGKGNKQPKRRISMITDILNLTDIDVLVFIAGVILGITLAIRRTK